MVIQNMTISLKGGMARSVTRTMATSLIRSRSQIKATTTTMGIEAAIKTPSLNPIRALKTAINLRRKEGIKARTLTLTSKLIKMLKTPTLRLQNPLISQVL